MKMLDLFAGTRSVSKEFEKAGWETYSVEWDKKFEGISLYADISKLTAQDVIDLCGGRPDVIWASPDCSSYSVAAIFHHREKVGNALRPKTEYAKFCDMTNDHVLELIEELRPRYFFIENPRAALRKMDFMLKRERERGFYDPLYGHILSIRGFQNETYRYMDQPSQSPIQTSVPLR